MLTQFYEYMKNYGLEWFNKYYSDYRGVVFSNKDPEGKGRIQAICPSAVGDQVLGKWIEPTHMTSGAGRGMFFPPEQGDPVWISFENGDAEYPIYRGGSWGPLGANGAEVPVELKPESDGTVNKRGFVTRARHKLIFDDTTGEEKIVVQRLDDATSVSLDKEGVKIVGPNGSFIAVDNAEGAVMIVDKRGQSFSITEDGFVFADSEGNTQVYGKGGIQLVSAKNAVINAPQLDIVSNGVNIGKDAIEPAVLGQQLFTWITSTLVMIVNSHVHGTAMGPTSRSMMPLTPPPPTILSRNVNVK